MLKTKNGNGRNFALNSAIQYKNKFKEKSWLSLLLVLSLSLLSLVACSSDDDEKMEESPTLTVAFECTVSESNSLMITCANTSTQGDSDTGLTYAWDFGVDGDDADVSTDKSPTYTYTEAGIYTITLTVTPATGDSKNGTQMVTITRLAIPTISTTAALTFEDGSTIPNTGEGMNNQLFTFTMDGTVTVDVVDNPNMTSGSGNESAKVLKSVESVGTQNWAGIGFYAQPLNTVLPTNCGIKMKVYGAEGLVISFEIEREVPGIGNFVDGMNTGDPKILRHTIASGMGDQWHTISFDFSSMLSAADAGSTMGSEIASGYNKLVFRLDSTDTDNSEVERTLHIDDIAIDTDVGACMGT